MKVVAPQAPSSPTNLQGRPEKSACSEAAPDIKELELLWMQVPYELELFYHRKEAEIIEEQKGCRLGLEH